jgi:hypothetical protein
MQLPHENVLVEKQRTLKERHLLWGELILATSQFQFLYDQFHLNHKALFLIKKFKIMAEKNALFPFLKASFPICKRQFLLLVSFLQLDTQKKTSEEKNCHLCLR